VAAGAVLGWGRALPPRAVANEELAAALGTTAAAIAERTGIARRHFVEPGVGPSDLGREASLAALAAAGLGPEDVDLIVFATMTPDIAFPGSGCFLQHKLGCRTVGALDVRAQCAGFLFALVTADRYVRSGKAERVLVVGGEVHSTALEMAPRAVDVTPVFGDGAGAVVVGAAERPGILGAVLHSDPTDLERFWCEFPASRHTPARMDLEHFVAGDHFYRLAAERVHPQAERALADAAVEALERAGVPAAAVALHVVHYFDPRVARRAVAGLGVPEGRILATAEAVGHVAAAGVPMAVADALAAGRVGPGDLVCCSAFGAGMSWGSVVVAL
jgi:3-oxoacyl-[acyl-carrier-protein] synthase-3